MEKLIQLQGSTFTPNSPKPINPHRFIPFLILSLIPIPCSSLQNQNPPPLPILPLPSAPQLQWQLTSMALFLHFGPNTFTDSEWGTGRADPSVFNPTGFNATQWVQVAKDSGFNRVILTAKHHDGFCLWPSEYTNYSVKSSSWRNGSGDVVKDLALAVKEAGLHLGLYLSPWDRHDPSYGDTLEYNEFYVAQMTELLTRYGEIKEVWLDGAKGEGEKDMEYYFERWISVIHQLQPNAVIFSDDGPDVRWIGDEAGVAGSTCWSLFNRSASKIGTSDLAYQQLGDPVGPDWVPAECDVSIRPGWFWHASEIPKSPLQLLDIYYKSVGRNCLMLLNVPPNTSGLISPQDIQVLKEFAELRTSIFSNNLAKNAIPGASSTRGSHFDSYNVLTEGIYTYWAPEGNKSNWELYFDLRESVSFNVVQIEEPIQMGQRIIEFHFEILEDGKWKTLINGTTVGFRRILRFPTVKCEELKLVIDRSREDPLVSYFGIYMDEFSVGNNRFGNSSLGHMNCSKEIASNDYFNGILAFVGGIRNHSQTAAI